MHGINLNRHDLQNTHYCVDSMLSAVTGTAIASVTSNLLLLSLSAKMHHAWLLVVVMVTWCYHIKVVLFRNEALHTTYLTIGYAILYWAISSNARASRTVFLSMRRERDFVQAERINMKVKHDAALLELQASAGMSRLYHVIKNILVGIFAAMDDSATITPEMRMLIKNEAQQGVDFIMQRFDFIALAKGTCK